MEEQQPPCTLADRESEHQEEYTGPSAAPSTKKRRLVDILCSAVCSTSSTQQGMSNEERVTIELSRYLGYNQILILLTGGSTTAKIFLTFLHCLKSTLVYVLPVAPQRGCLVPVGTLLQPNATV